MLAWVPMARTKQGCGAVRSPFTLTLSISRWQTLRMCRGDRTPNRVQTRTSYSKMHHIDPVALGKHVRGLRIVNPIGDAYEVFGDILRGVRAVSLEAGPRGDLAEDEDKEAHRRERCNAFSAVQCGCASTHGHRKMANTFANPLCRWRRGIVNATRSPPGPGKDPTTSDRRPATEPMRTL